MNRKSLSSFLIIAFIASQIMSPSAGWSGDAERGIRVEQDRQLVLSGLQGHVRTVSPNGLEKERTLNFGEALRYGDQIRTGLQSRAEILIGQQELVTLEEGSSMRINKTAEGTPIVEMQEGTVRLAVAQSKLASGEQVSVQTLSTRALSSGGIFHVTIGPGGENAGIPPDQQDSTMVLVGYSPMVMAKDEDTLVVYQVEEGTLTLKGKGQWIPVKAGQSVKVVNGQIGLPFVSPIQPSSPPPLMAAAQHSETPKPGLVHLADQEMKQAEILGYVLSGAAAKEAQEFEEQANSEQEVILATTGLAISGGNNLPQSLPPNGNLFPVSQEVGGPTGSLVDPVSNSSFNLVFGAEVDIPQPKGGGGLLLFNNSHVTLDAQINNGNQQIEIDFTPVNSALMLIDGGNPLQAPHQGKMPTERVTVTNLVFGPGVIPPDLNNPNPGRNQFLPFQFAPSLPDDGSRAHVLTRFSDPADFTSMINVLETFAASVQVVPGTGAQNIIFPPVDTNNNVGNGIHGVIRARDILGGDPIELAGGVVLNNNTDVVATSTEATANYFPQPNDIDGSIVAVLGRNFDLQIEDLIPEPMEPTGVLDAIAIMGGQLNPVNLKMEDRVLGVLDGSTIAPDLSDPFNIPQVSLLTILDSRLEGPTEPPDLIPGDLQPVAGVSEPPIPLGKSRADIPPLIEIINSGTPNLDPSDPAFKWAVEAHSAMVVRGELHQGILEASGPLVSLFQGTMATTGDFVNVQGNGTGGSAQLMASLQQSNVLQAALQLNNSQLQVGGHLFNFLNGATGAVTGNLTALANDSILSVNGALLAVGLNSSFTLTGGSLVAFGFGTNSVNITGTSGMCAGCNLSTNVPNLSGIPVLLHPSANVTVGNGFIPYAGVGQGTIGGMDFTNTVNVSPGAAVLQVDQGGTLVLNP